MEGRTTEDDEGDIFGLHSSRIESSGAASNSHQSSAAGFYFGDSENDANYSGEEQLHTTVRRFSLDDNPNGTGSPIKVFDRFNDSSSEDEDFFSAGSGCGTDNGNSVQSAGKRLDYMIQFLDRKLSSPPEIDTSNTDGRGLPEFVASGGGTGIFKLPRHAAVHPGRPPSLELRPRPSMETQIGCFLRTLESTGSQLWAGSERGIRFWKFSDLYKPIPNDRTRTTPSGDEEAAPFYQSVETSPTLCLVADSGSKVVWSGHKDGRIRSWKMDQSFDLVGSGHFKEALSWQAHRGPVLSMVMTCYGDLWSGSEGGVIKIWPWESIEKSLSLTVEERHMAAVIVERSYIDLRSQVTINGISNFFTSDVKYMLSDHTGGKVWSAGYLSFALWDSRTRELLKVFNMDGQTENTQLVQDLMEDEVKIKFASVSKKERQQGAVSFFQRSRNAIMGAADAVRRVAVKGAFGDRRTEALVATADGMIWTGCSSGQLVQWDGNGNRLQDFHHHFASVQCLRAFGLRLWVGYSSGIIQILDLNGKLLAEWAAHSGSVTDMADGSGYIFTLANHGGIRGWNITSPGPLDNILRTELAGKEFIYTRIENINILSGTWNVGQGRASQDSLVSWLGSVAANVSIVIVGLQEVEMGAGFLAMSAAKETMQVGLEGSSAGQWWLDMIGKTLDEGSTFERVGSRQLAGLLIAVWVRDNIRGHVGDIDVAAVPCGFGRAIGNKGAVGLRMRMYGRIMCFVNCHFAAHLGAVNRRNADFDYVYRTMIFSRLSTLQNAAAAGASSATQVLRGANAMGVNSVEGIPELSEADLVVFLGDFNYRLEGISYDEARDFVSQRSFDWLRERDQLRAEMKAGNVFQGMREAIIKFPPTYKFERHQAGLAGYDSGEKKRIPAWCDRVLYRDSRSASVSSCSLDCPVVSSISQYEACMDVTDSDHKPVRCILSVEIARVDESIRRQEFGEIIKSNDKVRSILESLCKVPEIIVSTNNIILQNQDTSVLRITNKSGKDVALYEIVCEGQSNIKEDGHASNHSPRGSFGFPRWLEIHPATGIIRPDQIMEISVHHEEFQTLEEFVDGVPQNSWCEDSKDKEVILLIKVRGSSSFQSKTHRIRVRHCYPTKTSPEEDTDPVPVPSNVLHRSNLQRLSNNYEVFDHLKSFRSP